jgi:uncharacterized peroxidase-related enzyme
VRTESEQGVVEAALADYASAPIAPRLKAMLAFLEKMTLEPTKLTPQDAIALRTAGLDDSAIQEAIFVASVFAFSNRVADALEYERPDAKGYSKIGAYLKRYGYGKGVLPG